MSQDRFQRASKWDHKASVNYVITNEQSDRTFDANTVAVAELADVVATLIKDLAELFPGNFTHSDS